MRRLVAPGESAREAAALLRPIDHQRSAPIKRRFGGDWPTRELCHLMINRAAGGEKVVGTIFDSIGIFEKQAAHAAV